MIKKIKSLKNFGIYSDFKWDHVSGMKDFKEKNIIYGWNYSGKTTISRMFSLLRKKTINEKFKNAEFKVETYNNVEIDHNSLEQYSREVHVFNSEYIKENLRWDTSESLDAIAFDVGENVLLRDKMKNNSDKINRIQGTETVKSKLDIHNKAFEDFNKFETSFTEEAKRIKLEFNSLIDFTKANFKTVKSKVENNLLAHLISDAQELIAVRKMALASNDKVKVEVILYNPQIKNLFDEVSSVLKSSPPQDEVIAILESNNELYQWAKRGSELHKELKDCSFCGQPITAERVNSLNNYFTNASSILRRKITSLKSSLLAEKEAFNKLNLPKSNNDLTDKCQQKYADALSSFKTLKKDYENAIVHLINDLDSKENGNIFIHIEASAYDDTARNSIIEWIKTLNVIIEEHNKSVSNFSTEQGVARDKLKNHSVSAFLIKEKYKEKERAKIRAEKYLGIYAKISDSLKSENLRIMAQLKSVGAGKDVLNQYIKAFLGRNDVNIELSADDRFMLRRGASYADNLSEGEKTAISFAYFLVNLESLHKEKKLVETIVFIDDPISSLDANHIAQIYSLINSFFFRTEDPDDPKKVINCFKQLFISTHNFEFFSFLKDSSQLKKSRNSPESGCEYYFIRRIGVNNSRIEPLPSRLRAKSEYVFLFELIYDFMKRGCPVDDEKYILIPNALRRFFEIYTLLKLPGTDTEIDQRLNKLMGGPHQLKVLHHFSHFTSFEKLTKHDELILALPDAINELMSLLKKDTLHFNSLLEAIDRNEEI